MGKRDKQKPAASSKAADFLEKSAVGSPLFSGYNDQTCLSFSSTIANPNNFQEFLNLDPELRVLIKKFSKREAITKVKALEELLNIINTKPDLIVTEIIPLWESIFVKLGMDFDRRVRETTLGVHLALVKKAAKNIAPILKKIVGTWIICRFDPSKEVSNLAIESFNVCFSKKIEQVLIFCQKEIILYVFNNILEQTPQSMSDSRYTTPEDTITKHARTIAGCFDCLSYIIEQIPLEKRLEIDSYQLLFNEKTFWAHATHEQALIKQSMYRFIRQCCLSAPDIVQLSISFIASQFLSKVFSEKDPSGYAHIWDSVLLLTKNFPEIWIMASEKKPAVNKIFNFLQQGGFGSGWISYPCILPLIGHLPAQIKNEHFFLECMSSFWKGCDKIDRSTYKAFMKAYYECCLYLIKSGTTENAICLASVDFIVPVGAFLNEASSKLPGHDIMEAFNQFTIELLMNNLDSAISTSFQQSFAELLLKSLQVSSISSLSVVVSSFFSVHATKNLVNMDSLSNDLLLALLALDQDRSDVAFTIIWKLCSVEDLQFNKKSLDTLAGFLSRAYEAFPDNWVMSTNVILSVIRFFDSPALAAEAWGNVINVIVTSSEALPILEHVFSYKFWKLVQSKIHGASSALDEFLLEKIMSLEEEEDALLSSITAKCILNSLLKEETGLRIVEFAVQEVNLLAEALYMNAKNEKLLIDFCAFEKGLFGVQLLGNISFPDLDPIYLSVYFAAWFSLINFLTCDPNTIGLFRWKGQHSRDTLDAFECLSREAKIAVKKIEKLCTKLEHEQAISCIQSFGATWKSSLNNLDHCGSPIDFLEEFRIILKLFEDPNLNDFIWESCCCSQQDWATLSAPFCSSHSSSMAIAEPILYWAALSGLDTSKDAYDINYDRDGLCQYSRTALLFISIFKDEKIVVPKAYSSIIEELVRFMLVCKDSLYEEKPFPFKDHVKDHYEQVRDQILLVLSRVPIDDVKAQLNSIYNLELDNDSESKGLMVGSYRRAIAAPGEMEKISNARVFGFFLNQQAGKQISDSKRAIVIKRLFQMKENSLVSAFLPSSTVENDAEFESQNYQSHFKLLLNGVLQIKKRSGISNDTVDVSPLIHFCHFLSSFSFAADEFITRQVRTTILRWIRGFFDSAVAGEIISRDGEPRFLLFFDSLIFNLLSILQSDINSQEEDIGLNLAKFLTELCLYSLKQIQISAMSHELACLLFYNIRFWSNLREAADLDSESWQRVVDVENDVESIILDLFIKTGQPEILTTIGIAKLQSEMAEEIIRLDPGDHLRVILSSEAQIYNIFNTRNVDTDKAAFFLIKAITCKRIEELSVSVEMQGHDESISLSKGLVELVSKVPKRNSPSLFGYLLGWLDLLDHFTFDLRQIYSNNLRDLNITDSFLDLVFDILRVNEGESFNLSQWQFEEYEYTGFDSSSDSSVPLLCAYLYLRMLKGLPALVRLWYMSCSNRQLLLAVESYTERFFSPLLLKNEYQAVQKLSDKELSVKVHLQSRNISATYTFEEAELDILIKMPACYPLKAVEVSSGSGGRTAGISDSRWRGWLLGVSSILIGHNGSIADALTLFKKNVSLHFEGIEDCAICYSVISLIDRSTPQKGCRVCKRKFHGSCVFKWFKSSNQSSCPLCRQPM